MRQCLLIMFLLLSAQLYGQLDISKQNMAPVTPEWRQYEFQRYGKIGTTLYTGTVNYEIPLFVYRDKDFEFPITIKYATNGFRVNHKSGILGHGWTLSVGGEVTREIKGIPDEMSVATNGGTYGSSTYYGYKHAKASHDEYGVPAMLVNVVPPMPGGIRQKKPFDGYDETEPDIYSFNFDGHSGCFERKADSEKNGFRMFNVAGADRGLAVRDVENGYITMADARGYLYSFTSVNSVPASRFKMTDDSETGGVMRYDDVTLGWHLNNIEAPNGREIRIGISPVSCDYNYFVSSSMYYCSMDMADNTRLTPDLSMAKMCNSYRIDSVAFADGTVARLMYEKGRRELALDRSDRVVGALGDSLRLKEVVVEKDGRLIRKCCFEYFVTDPGGVAYNQITFLKSVTVSGEGVFSFDYNMTMPAPKLATRSYDEWGYYNGKDKRTGWPQSEMIEFGEEDRYREAYDKSKTEPRPQFALLGTLCRIGYPTGGHSELLYEPHDYSRQIERTPDGLFLPQMAHLETNSITGGVRIKRVVTFVADSAAIDTVDYAYTSAADSTLSSGILLYTPRYGLRYEASAGPGVNKRVLFYSTDKNMFDSGRTHIEYSHVTETRTDGGITEYFYTTSNDYADYIGNPGERSGGEANECYPVPNVVMYGGQTFMRRYSLTSPYVINLLSPVCSRQFMRGRLLRTDYKDAGGRLLRRVERTFDWPLVNNDSVLCVVGEDARWFVFPRHNMEVTSETVTDFAGGVSSVSTERYTYNSHGMTAEVSKKESDGSETRVVNMYAGDSIACDGVCGKMAANNVVDCLTERRVYNSGTLVAAERYGYCLPNAGRPALARQCRRESLAADGSWRFLAAYDYDGMGNLTQAVSADSVVTAYLWSYGSQNLVAEITNCSYQRAGKILGQIGFGSALELAGLSSPTYATLQRMNRMRALLPDSHVVLYKYNFCQKLTETTMPNGLRAYYSYDGYGRLVETRDNEGKTREQIGYATATVEKLSVGLQPDKTVGYLTGSAKLVATAKGGSGVFKCRWTVKRRGGAVVLDSIGIELERCLSFDTGTYRVGNYVVSVVVTDEMSGETVTAECGLEVRNLPIEFSDVVVRTDNPIGRGSVTAKVMTTASAKVRFVFGCQTGGTCKVTVCGNTYTFTGHQEDVVIEQKIDAPYADVRIDISGAVAESAATLAIVSAGNMELGNAQTIDLLF